MMGTTVRLADHLAELKQKRDTCINRIRTLTTKMNEIGDQRREAERDLVLGKKPIEELEDLEDDQVGSEEPRTYAAGAHPDTAESMYGPRQMPGMVRPPASAWPNVNACIDRSKAAQAMGQAAGEPAPFPPQPPPPPPQTNQKK
eukprot:3199242-Pyramimonas_sp.AAC.1